MNAAPRPTLPPRQQGNTLVGVIIGLVIGLVIAVIVALAITKGSMPFTDKTGKAGKAAEPAAGQITDPNKPMYGNKDAAREAAAMELDKEPKAEPKAPDVLQQVIASLKPEPAHEARPEKPESKPEPKPEPAPRPAPADKARPVAVAAAPAPARADAAVEDKWVYYLQAGAFREAGDAESTRAKLALLGFEATISERNTDNGVLHRVRMGPYGQIEAMNRARSKLSENGVDVAVIRNQK